MSVQARPSSVGSYRLLQDFVAPEASVRVIEMAAAADAVEPHLHLRSTQVYVALEGTAVVNVGGVEREIEPYQAVRVPAAEVHSVRPRHASAVVANISVPPLEASDQLPQEPDA